MGIRGNVLLPLPPYFHFRQLGTVGPDEQVFMLALIDHHPYGCAVIAHRRHQQSIRPTAKIVQPEYACTIRYALMPRFFYHHSSAGYFFGAAGTKKMTGE